MNIFIDGDRSTLTAVPSADVQGYIGSLKERLRQGERLVESFVCEGKRYSNAEFLSDPAYFARMNEVNVITKSFSSVIQDAVKEAYEKLPALIKSLREMCRWVRKDKISEGLKAYMTMSVYLKTMLMGLASVKEASRGRFTFNAQETIDTVQEINDALKDKDYVRFSDSVEYRLIVLLEAMYSQISSMVKEKVC